VTKEETWWRLSASEVACYKYPDDTDMAKAERAAFIEGFVIAARNTHEALKAVGALPD
jgi:hypothetical protein